MLRGVTYLNRDNPIELVLTENDTAINHTAITRVRLELPDAVVIDSDTEPALFDIGQADKITLLLGEADVDPGTYTTRLIIFTGDYPNGLVWMEIELRFIA